MLKYLTLCKLIKKVCVLYKKDQSSVFLDREIHIMTH